MRPIGIHVSIAHGVNLAVSRAIEDGCVSTFQIFTCSPRRWAASELDPLLAQEFRRSVSLHNFVPFAHMPYMPNLASNDDNFYKQSVQVLVREVNRCSELGINYLVLHFGSHMGSSVDEGHERVIAACRRTINETGNSRVRLLLETSAGTRNSIGSKFEFVKKVLDRVGDRNRTGVCVDTCHIFASGYDLRNEGSARATIEEFNRVIGLDSLYLIHMNDSKGGFAEGRDRHEHIGNGQIGSKGFRALFEIEDLKKIPFILETPIDSIRDDKQEVAFAKKLAKI